MDPVAAVALAVGSVFEGIANIIVTGPRRLGRAFDISRPDVIDPLDPGELKPKDTTLLVIVLSVIVLVGVIVYSASRK